MQAIGEVFGFIGGVIGIATGLPQALRIRKQGNSDGLALSPWILMIATFSAYTGYGLIQNSPAIWICNALTFFTTALVVTAVKGNGFKVWSLIILGGLASAVVVLVLPPLLSNAVLLVLTANRLPQLIRTWMNRHTAMISAVSISSLLVALTSMACWGAYAILTGNNFIVLTTIVAMSITISTALLEGHIARLARKARFA